MGMDCRRKVKCQIFNGLNMLPSGNLKMRFSRCFVTHILCTRMKKVHALCLGGGGGGGGGLKNIAVVVLSFALVLTIEAPV